MRKIMMALGLVVAVLLGIGTASAAVKPGPVAKITKPVIRPVVRVFHPCDFDRNTVIGNATERLCMRVWGHDAYSVDGSETPAGPVVVVGLIDEARVEGAGIAYVREGLKNEMDNYARRDR